MKRIIVAIAVFALWAQVAEAQLSIEDIRREYANVKEHIARMSGEFPEEGIPHEYYQLKVNQNLPATGPHFEDLRMYFGHLDGEERIYDPHYLWFASTKYNFAAREYYEEYLYDDKGNILFIYSVYPDIVSGKFYDLRLYYNGSKLLKCIVKRKNMDEMEYHEIYNGTKVPEEYVEMVDMLYAKGNANLQLFKQIEYVAYPYSE